MDKFLLSVIISASLLSGCASVNTASVKETNEVKQLTSPSEGKAGVYIYRADTIVGAALKKDIWIDSECVGASAKGVFFYHEVDGDASHVISTESEFSPNKLEVNTKSGHFYYIQQYIKPGVFVGGADLEQHNEVDGKNAISGLKMASKGNCSSVL